MKLSTAPGRVAARAVAMLERAGDPRDAAQARTYFKPHEKIRFYGVPAPRLRRIEKAIYAEVRGAWEVRDAVAICGRLLRSDVSEVKNLGILLLARYRKSFEPSLLPTLHEWLRDDRCDNWSATDALCGWVLAPLLGEHSRLVPTVARWSGAKNLWVRRASAVALIPHARHGHHLDAAYRVAEALLGDGEDLIHKATGWLLREAGRTDPRRLERYLIACGSRIPRTALRYAIERFPPEKRMAILSATRREVRSRARATGRARA
jgi:3-methyladenine DNA glycosylase AlkD